MFHRYFKPFFCEFRYMLLASVTLLFVTSILTDVRAQEDTISFGVGQSVAVLEGFTADVTVKLSRPPANGAISVPIVVHSRHYVSAAERDDYQFVDRVTFNQGQTTKTITVEAVDDKFYEGNEWFILGFGELPEGWSAGSMDYVSIQIIDDDGFLIWFSRLDSTSGNELRIEEGQYSDEIELRLARRHDSGDDEFPNDGLTVELRVDAQNTSAQQEDYSFDPQSVEFNELGATRSIRVTAIDDKEDENTETIRLTYDRESLPIATGSSNFPQHVDVHIVDNDETHTIAFNRPANGPYEATEGGAAAMVTVTLEPAADRELVIPLVVHNMPGGATEEDYSFPADVTFDQGETSKAVTVTAKDDEFYDSGETVRLAFGSPLPAGVIADPAQAVADVTLLDDDPVQAVVAEREAIESTLQAVATATAANITANVGARFSAARSGTNLTSLSLAGQSVTQPSTFEETGWNALWNQESRSRTLSSDELLRTTDFQIVLGASEGTQAQAAETWTFWGRGDLQFFSSEPSQGSSYDGDLRAGYFGLDTQVDDQWLAGIAVSRTMAEADYSLGISGADNDGTMDVTLTSLIPYVRFAPDSESELWAIVGAGQGAIENSRPGAASDRANLQETSDVAMLMASAGGRHAMALGDPLDWALLGDVGFGRVLTEDGVEAIAGLTVDTWQARVGVEGSYTVVTEDGGILTAFMEVAGRYDGGDEGEVGLELSPGIYIARPDTGFGLELRGRALVLHSAENYEEYGLSATASMTPRSDGTGLSLSLSPRWGDDTGGADTLWRDESLGLLGSSSSNRNTISLDARVGYGVRAMNGLLTPFSEFGVRDEDSQYWRIGARFNRIHTDPGTLNLELSGERRESLSGDPEHRVGVTSWLRF